MPQPKLDLTKFKLWINSNAGTLWKLRSGGVIETYLSDNGVVCLVQQIPIPDEEKFKTLAKAYIDEALHLPEMIQCEFSSDYLKFKISWNPKEKKL